MVFCHQNGCNKLATGFVPGPYQFLYDLPQYLLIGILIAALVFLLAALFKLCICDKIVKNLRQRKEQEDDFQRSRDEEEQEEQEEHQDLLPSRSP